MQPIRHQWLWAILSYPHVKSQHFKGRPDRLEAAAAQIAPWFQSSLNCAQFMGYNVRCVLGPAVAMLSSLPLAPPPSLPDTTPAASRSNTVCLSAARHFSVMAVVGRQARPNMLSVGGFPSGRYCVVSFSFSLLILSVLTCTSTASLSASTCESVAQVFSAKVASASQSGADVPAVPIADASLLVCSDTLAFTGGASCCSRTMEETFVRVSPEFLRAQIKARTNDLETRITQSHQIFQAKEEASAYVLGTTLQKWVLSVLTKYRILRELMVEKRGEVVRVCFKNEQAPIFSQGVDYVGYEEWRFICEEDDCMRSSCVIICENKRLKYKHNVSHQKITPCSRLGEEIVKTIVCGSYEEENRIILSQVSINNTVRWPNCDLACSSNTPSGILCHKPIRY
ncbi:hypothetical protein PoB_004297700 [Plakobranchus ocellatus]|uniref:Uncharacterized protein n=1 Tax=Plakobranchus ocellatus TaxID=259542 RepID=A0AAV4BBG9_9GAST|nr:hypothetical protein PoB_004297700 [Plakobranchus ocellatus]